MYGLALFVNILHRFPNLIYYFNHYARKLTSVPLNEFVYITREHIRYLLRRHSELPIATRLYMMVVHPLLTRHHVGILIGEVL